MTPIAGALGVMFGVCCNEMAADGRVVEFGYGCGAHSDTPAPHGAGSPAFEPYDDGVFDVVTVAAQAPMVEVPEADPVGEAAVAEVADEVVEVAGEVIEVTDDATADDESAAVESAVVESVEEVLALEPVPTDDEAAEG
jgi:hypothetical protein